MTEVRAWINAAYVYEWRQAVDQIEAAHTEWFSFVPGLKTGSARRS
jgi:hypothetical protein